MVVISIMEYCTSWQRIVSAASNTGATSLSRPTHYTNIATSSPPCRSVWWRLLLGVLPRDAQQWLQVLRQHRSNYDELRHRLSVTPGVAEETDDLSLNNPLSQDTQSSWNQYFEDSELKRLIRQDVVRTFPEERFFHTPFMQETMVAILFCYAREHEDISYKQGLHEVLAPLLLALHCDHKDYDTARKQNTLQPLIQEVMDTAYMEHDAYSLFCGVMGRLGQWYLTTEGRPPPPLVQQLRTQPFVDTAQSPTESPHNLSPLQSRIQAIYGDLLSAHLPRLADHLAELDIPPQVYAIRWLRLLFGREFALKDLPVVWDALLWCCTSTDLPLVDYVALALMESVQGQLLASDYLGCLNLLMRFPTPSDVTALLAAALHKYTASRQQTFNERRQRHNSYDHIDSNSGPSSLSPLHHSTANSFSSLPPQATSRPATLPPLDLHIHTTASTTNGHSANAAAATRHSTTATTNLIRPSTAGAAVNSSSNSFSSGTATTNLSRQPPGPAITASNTSTAPSSSSSSRRRTPSGEHLSNGSSSNHAPAVSRVQSLHGGVTRSRSQVTRCVSEGGGGRRVVRHPSASPRRGNADQVVTYSAQKDAVEAETTSSHKSNLLNFVKFGTVKFGKPRDGPAQEAARTDGSSSEGRMLDDLSAGGRKCAQPPSAALAAASGHQLSDTLQRLAGELSGHLSALGHRHHQLKVDADLSVRVTMDSLRQVSRALQDAADGQDWDTIARHASSPHSLHQSPSDQSSTSSSMLHHPLEHPLQASPD